MSGSVRPRGNSQPLEQFGRSLSPESEPFLEAPLPEKSCCEKTVLVAAKFFGGVLAVGAKGAFVGFCTGAALSIGIEWEFVNFEDTFNEPKFALGMAKMVGSCVFGCIASSGFFRFPSAGFKDPAVSIRSFLSRVIF